MPWQRWGNCSGIFLPFRGVSPCCWFQHTLGCHGGLGISAGNAHSAMQGLQQCSAASRAQGTMNTMLAAQLCLSLGCCKTRIFKHVTLSNRYREVKTNPELCRGG